MSKTKENWKNFFGNMWVSHLGNSMSSGDRDDYVQQAMQVPLTKFIFQELDEIRRLIESKNDKFITKQQALLEKMVEAVYQVLDDMDAIRDYDPTTDAPIWEDDMNKKGTSCCIAAREELQEIAAEYQRFIEEGK